MTSSPFGGRGGSTLKDDTLMTDTGEDLILLESMAKNRRNQYQEGGFI